MYFLPPIVTMEEFAEFRERVLAVREIVQPFGYGVQAQIAYDTRMNASRISATIRCKAIDEECLARIEAWAKIQTIPVQHATIEITDLEEAAV